MHSMWSDKRNSSYLAQSNNCVIKTAATESGKSGVNKSLTRVGKTIKNAIANPHMVPRVKVAKDQTVILQLKPIKQENKASKQNNGPSIVDPTLTIADDNPFDYARQSEQ